MKMIVAFAALVAVASAASFAPVPSKSYKDEGVVVLKEVPHDNIGLGGYKYSYELSDGQSRSEVADVTSFRDAKTGEENFIYKVKGSFSFVNPHDGQTYTVQYVADENGFQPQGAHLPSV